MAKKLKKSVKKTSAAKSKGSSGTKKVAKKVTAAKASSKKKTTRVKSAAKSKAKSSAKAIVKTKAPVKATKAKSLMTKSPSAPKANTSSSADQAASLVGQTIAPFSVLNSKGNEVTQDSLKGRKTVLYFYPKDDTPGCTLEGQQFSKLAPEFNDANTVVLGVSKDSVASHDKFICKYDFKIDLVSDEKEQLCKIFDVIKEKNMYGKKYMGIERSTFVLDENLKVVKEMRKVSPDGHAEQILEFVKSL